MPKRTYIRPEISRDGVDVEKYPRMNSEEGQKLKQMNAWEKDRKRKKKAIAYRKRLEARVQELEKLVESLRRKNRSLREDLHLCKLSGDNESESPGTWGK